MRRLILAAMVLASVPALAEPTIVEGPTPAVSDSGVLTQNFGIETLGGVFTYLIDRGCRVPCSISKTFPTAVDNQTEVKLLLYRGNAKLSKDATALGVYTVIGIPALPRAEPQVAVTFSVLRDKITVAAVDKKTNLPLVIAK